MTPMNVKKVSLKDGTGRTKKSRPAQSRRRFAAKIHDLRQPLQVMSLLHGILAEKIKDEEALKTIARLDEVMDSLSHSLDALFISKPVEHTIPCPENHRPPLAEPKPACETIVPQSVEKKKLKSSICIVDDDRGVREGMGDFLKACGHSVQLFGSCENFLEARQPDHEGCLLIDAMLPGMSGLELLRLLKDKSNRLPAIMITGSGDVSLAVQAMKAGAADFVEKPVSHKELLAVVTNVLEKARNASHSLGNRDAAIKRLACLSPRERQIMDLIFEGHPSKNIATDLSISRRTVEGHRANIIKKTEVRSLSALLKLALAAA